ncbi:efflux RND transporter permease subunit [Bacillus xiapuensis]|uniref:efflux RND transporter permease subunit n=1 Tax=Bacillus xiapuensis TaxID=2014075 RepID=UPI000C23A70F|nr:efflux RND transporter permease subunit [Bacillus xiapuensis]
MFLTKWSIKNGVAVFLLCLLILGGGILSSRTISKEIMPDVSYPALFVQMTTPGGTSAEENEENITKPFEERLEASEDTKSITSTTSSQMITFIVEYPYGTDLDKSSAKLETLISGLALPEYTDHNILTTDSMMNTILQFAIASDRQEELQESLNETIIPEMKKIAGIANININGELKKQWMIEVDEKKAKEHGLTLEAVKQSLESTNKSLSVGTIENDGATIPVDLTPQVRSIEQLKQLKVSAQLPPGTAAKPVALGDIAKIEMKEEEQETSRYNGKPAFVIDVTKEKSGNTVEITKAIHKVIDKYKEKEKFEVYPIMDFGNEIETSISKLVKEGLFGALFTVIVIALFLRSFRATIISIISLPVSIFVTIFIFEKMGYSLNVMTLGGLAVAIGRIVDDGIVVIENIDRWLKEKGDQLPKKEIAEKATKEVMKAVGSSTIVTCIVFLPIVFVSGYTGEQFRPFSLAVVFSIIASYLVAIMLIPMLGSVFLKKKAKKERESKLLQFYEKCLRGALKRKWLVIIASIMLLVGSFALVPMMGFSLMPSESGTSMKVGMTLPVQATLDETNAASEKIESYLQERKEVDYSSAEVGQSLDQMNMQKKDNQALFIVKLKKGYQADSLLKEFKGDLEKEVPKAEITVEDFSPVGGAPGGNEINVELYGDNFAALKKASGMVEEELKKNDDLKNIRNEMTSALTKWEVEINEEGRQANVNSQQILSAVQERLLPVQLLDYEIQDELYQLTLAYNQKISTKEQLLNLKVPTGNGEKPLKEVAEVKEVKTPQEIKHEGGKALAKVTATVKGQNVLEMSQKIEKEMKELSFPEGVTLKTGGANEEINKEFTNIISAMLMAIGLVFIVLCATFQGIWTPVVILTSILFVPIGSFSLLLATGQPLSLSSMIGLLMLIGVVVTNAVVLLDRVETNRKEGMDITEALVEAGKVRLRPIVMTAVATICALIPLALSSDTESVSAALISKGLAITVIGGLTTSTLLTLIVVPSIYKAVKRERKNKNRDMQRSA